MTDELESRASAAITRGRVEAFLDLELVRDRDGLVAWLNGNGLPVHIFLPIAEASARSARVALLRPSRQLVLEEHRWIGEVAKKAAEEAGPSGRPSGSILSTRPFERERDVPLDVAHAALRYVLGATDPRAILDAAHRLLFHAAVKGAAELPELDDVVAEKLALEPDLFFIPYPEEAAHHAMLFEGRLVGIHLKAMRASPAAANELKDRLSALTGIDSGQDGDAFARAVEAWYRENADFLEVDRSKLPPRPFGRGWFRVDLFAKLAGRSCPRPAPDDPRRKAFEALPRERREALARESAALRASDFARWTAWIEGELEKLR